MSLPSQIQRLARQTSPDDGLRLRVKRVVKSRIEPEGLVDAIRSVHAPSHFRTSLKYRVLRSIRSEAESALPHLAGGIDLAPERRVQVKRQVLARLSPRAVPWASGFIKWTAACAAFLLVVRTLPLVFLAPVLQAETSVQLVANGDVRVTVAGIEMKLTDSTRFLPGSAKIETGASQATLILNDDGVVRLAEHTTVHLHDIGDRPHFASLRPTLTLDKGQVWMLGMLPPGFLPISVGTSQGIASVNAGSMSVRNDGTRVTVSVYDRGASFRQPQKPEALLVAGERIVVNGKTVTDSKMPSSQFVQPWVSVNLDMDAVHRTEIAQLQQERRQKMAGVLPGEIWYPAKRLAEKVDVIFTLNHEARVGKIVQQADTRFNEAMTLIDQGQGAEAEGLLSEYHDTLVAYAGSGDTVARFLVQKQIDEASSTIAVASAADDEFAQLQQTVLDLSTAIPDADSSRNIQGYVLVDKLIELNQSLDMSASLTDVVATYEALKPQLAGLLAEDDTTHPLLKKEATALLASISEKIDTLSKDADAVDEAVTAVQGEIAKYLPPEEETARLLVSEAELDAEVDAMVSRIFTLKMPRSRYNQLIAEMADLRTSRNPNRGTLLRRLYRKLPQNGLAGFVQTEIKNMGDELNVGEDLKCGEKC